MSELNAAYAARFKAVSDDTQSRSKKIQDDGPSSGDAGLAIGVTGHFETRKLNFSMDVPEVTIKDQRMSFDFPEIRMNTRTFSYDTIRATATQECRAGIDETVVEWHTCDSGKPWAHPCMDLRTRRGADVCLPSVKMEPYREEVRMDIPETRMTRREFVMGIPETTMKTQKMSFDYPVYILDSVEATAEKQKKESEALKAQSSQAIAVLSTAMQNEVKGISRKPLEQAYECQKSALRSAFRQQYDTLMIGTASIQAGLESAKQKNIPPAVQAYQAALNQQQQAKIKIFTDYRKQRAEAEKTYKTQLAKLDQPVS